jgi:hypothetical protein
MEMRARAEEIAQARLQPIADGAKGATEQAAHVRACWLGVGRNWAMA